MDFLATPIRRRFLFAALYFSEGAPIGFLWLALPTRLKASGVPLERITWLTAVLVLPWTFKFVWAPLLDVMRSSRWTLRHWILVAQSVMGITLIPLLWIDPVKDFRLLVTALLAHAFAAATQDVAIDALCITETPNCQRGSYNGWMQTGMLLGRAGLGGGALVLSGWLGDQLVVVFLIICVLFSGVLVLVSQERKQDHEKERERWDRLGRVVQKALQSPATWLGLLFGLFGGSAFKSLEVVYGPFLIDRGYTQSQIGWFSAGPMILSMITGSIVGGYLADRIGRRRFVALSLLYVVSRICCLALSDHGMKQSRGFHLGVFLVATALGIGLFTSASYALFMDLTDPEIGASQFSAFMGSTNGCESWSTYAIGRIIGPFGYATGFLTMSAVSTAAILLLIWMRPREER